MAFGMKDASNDNAGDAGRQGAAMVPIVGWVGGEGRVTITDPDWRPAAEKRPPRLRLVDGDVSAE